MPYTTPIMVLDHTAFAAKLMIPKVDASLPRPNVDSSNPPLKAPLFDDSPMTLLRNENLAWNRFKQVVRNKDISICYDMTIKEFEHLTTYDFFKVTFASSILSHIPRLQVAF